MEVVVSEVDWRSAEDVLCEQSLDSIRRFAAEHSGEVFSTFAFSVDSAFAGVGLHFDTFENSTRQARRHESRRTDRLNELFAREEELGLSRLYVSSPGHRVDAWNLHRSFDYHLVTSVELPSWEEYFRSGEEPPPDLEPRIIVSLWRMVDRLVTSGAFDGLQKSHFFRVAFCFHDGEWVVLRILNWPEVEELG